jgi:predicted dehydrogenase
VGKTRTTRRQFLKTSVGTAAWGATLPYFWSIPQSKAQAANERITVAAIGVGGRGSGIGHQAAGLGNMVACCDVDSERAAKFAANFEQKCDTYGNYRNVLERNDVDAVTIGTPDHWHTKISIDAMRAGKDVYCEKPLTLTVDEGKQICKVVQETGRVFQVGTQQRSEYNQKFLKAIAIAQSGRLGKTLKATASVGTAKSGGPFEEENPPGQLDWEMWLGQAPQTPYIEERAHYHFRWWLEYSGGQVTDWGVHHLDIAMWALGLDQTGPVTVEGVGEFNNQKNCFNVAHTFDCNLDFANGNQIVLTSGENELIIEGELGRIRVNRRSLTGKVVEEITESEADQDWLQGEIQRLYKGRPFDGHMQNFFDCVKDRSLPVSDVFTHHRSVSACHLANIAMLLKRKVTWNPEKEDFVSDPEASAMLSREQREGYRIEI